jgi:hypothetical protein
MTEGQEYTLDFFAKVLLFVWVVLLLPWVVMAPLVRNGFGWKQYGLHLDIRHIDLVLGTSSVCGIQVARSSEKGCPPAVLWHRRYVLARFPDLAIPKFLSLFHSI